MFDEMTLSNGSPLSEFLSCSRYNSALIASSPRTAYWTFNTDGFSESAVRGRMLIVEVEKKRFGPRKIIDERDSECR